MRFVNRLPLHARLVAGFVAAMFVLLTGAGVFVYWRVEYALNRGLDGELRRATQTIAPLVRADGTVSDDDRANLMAFFQANIEATKSGGKPDENDPQLQKGFALLNAYLGKCM